MIHHNGYLHITSCQLELPAANINYARQSANNILLCVKNGNLHLRIEGDSLFLPQSSFILLQENTRFSYYTSHASAQIFLLEINSRCTPESIPVEETITVASIIDYDPYISRFLNLHAKYLYAENCFPVLNFVTMYMREYNHVQKRSVMLGLITTQIVLEIAFQITQSEFRPKMIPLNLANQYILDNMAEDIQVEDIARASNISVSYLQKLFHDEYQHGIKQHLILIRLQQACQLLGNTDQTIVDIAIATGFNSRQHFTYTFKQHYSMSPQQYRKIHKLH